MGTKSETKKKEALPTYTVAEFAAAPASVGANSPDVVNAAFSFAGKKEATVDEAKALVEKFKNKEVK